MIGVPEPVVETRALAKRYGERQAVVDLSFRVEAGECVGLLGPNGAGKTTTIRMLTGFAVPSAGEVRGARAARSVPRPRAAIKARLGMVSQEDSLDPDLSVEKNLLVYAQLLRHPVARGGAQRTDELIAFAELRRSPHASASRRSPAACAAGSCWRARC